MVSKAPILFRGPDPSRVYAKDFSRWVFVSGPDDLSTLAMLTLNNSFGIARLIGILIFPLIGFLTSILVSRYVEDPMIVWGFAMGGGFAGLMVFVLGYLEYQAFSTWPRKPIVVNNDLVCLLNDGQDSIAADENTFFRVTEYLPAAGWSGSESSDTYSELDIVFAKNGSQHAIPLIAYSHSWCKKHGERLSSKTGIRLELRNNTL